MRLRPRRTELLNWIAFANLALFAAVLLVLHLVGFWGGKFVVVPRWMHFLYCVLLILGFPLAWLSAFLAMILGSKEALFTLFISIPLNAYLWGWLGQCCYDRFAKGSA